MATDPRATAGKSQVATISHGIVVSGNVHCEGELQINGQINGDVRAVAIFVDTDGQIKGGVAADRLRVAGIVEGNIQVGDLAVEANGEIRGEVKYGRIKVDADGHIDGSFARSSEHSAPRQDRTVKLVETHPAENPRRVYVE